MKWNKNWAAWLFIANSEVLHCWNCTSLDPTQEWCMDADQLIGNENEGSIPCPGGKCQKIRGKKTQPVYSIGKCNENVWY